MKIRDLRIRRTREVDMSPEAIAERLARLEQLVALGLSLRHARRIRKATDARPSEPSQR